MSSYSAKHTFKYKTEPVDFLCDVYLPKNKTEGKASVFVYFHGGGLCAGFSGAWIPQWLLDDSLNAGFIFVSADYRLLTPSNCFDIKEDTLDFMKWIQTDLNQELSKLPVGLEADTDKVVVSGSSAGAYLTAMAGLYANPKPKGLFYNYPLSGDMLVDFWCVPKGSGFLGGAPDLDKKGHFKALKENKIPVTKNDVEDEKDPRNDYGLWLIQEAELLDVMLGVEGLGKKLNAVPYEKRAEVIPEDVKILLPQFAIAEAGDSFPPTMLLYAGDDEVVPAEEGVTLEKVLKGNGVDVELLEFPGRLHAFDHGEVTKEEKDKLNRVVPFLLKALEK